MKPKTKYEWNLMPDRVYRKRGEFDDDRYVLKGHEIAQMEKNQQTEYNNLLRRQKEGSNNIKLEGLHSLMEFKIANAYDELRDKQELNEFIQGTNAGLTILTEGAKLRTELEKQKGVDDANNPENAEKYVEYWNNYDKLYQQYAANGLNTEQILAEIRSNPTWTRLQEDLIRGKSAPRAAEMMKRLAAYRGFNAERHQDFILKNVVRTAPTPEHPNGLSYKELIATVTEGGKRGEGEAETNASINTQILQLEAKAKVLATNSLSIIDSLDGKVRIPQPLTRQHITPALEKANDNRAITRASTATNNFYDDVYREAEDDVKAVLTNAITAGTGPGLEGWNQAVTKFALKTNSTNQEAEVRLFELMEAALRKDGGATELGMSVLAFMDTPVPSEKDKNVMVPMSTRKHRLFAETGLYQTAVDIEKQLATNLLNKTNDIANSFILQQNMLGVDDETFLNNVDTFLETTQAQFMLKYNPNSLTNIYNGVITSSKENEILIKARIINEAKGNGGTVSRAVALKYRASDKLIKELTEGGYIHKINFPDGAPSLDEAVATAVRHMKRGDSGAKFKDIESNILQVEVKQAFNSYWKMLTDQADHVDPVEAWKKSWELITENQDSILQKARAKKAMTPIVRGHSISRRVLAEVAKAGGDTKDIPAYLRNNSIPEMMPEIYKLVQELAKEGDIRPDDFAEKVHDNVTLKVAAKRMGVPIMRMVDWQLRQAGIVGGNPNYGEDYTALARQIGPSLLEQMHSSENQARIAANSFSRELQEQVNERNLSGDVNQPGLLGPDNRLYGQTLSDINEGAGDGRRSPLNSLVDLSTEDGRAALIKAWQDRGYERHGTFLPSLVGGYNLDSMHTRLLSGAYVLDTLSGGVILNSIYRTSGVADRKVTKAKDFMNQSKSLEIEIAPNSEGYEWLSSQNPDDLKKLGFELKKFRQGRVPGYLLSYVGETNPHDIRITTLADRVSIPHNTRLNEGIQEVLVQQAWKKSPLTSKYNGKTFFELTPEQQLVELDLWKKAYDESAGNGLYITPGVQ